MSPVRMSHEQQQIDELRALLQASEDKAQEYRERTEKYTADLLHRDKQREEAIEKFQKVAENQAEAHRRYVAANEANQVLEEQQGNQREEFDMFKTQVMQLWEAASQAQG
ncbi:MAG: zinc ABC transporter substrate-binding protein, partial [Gammaproteobacteria bacterium]|nr:zinc ABC transporter substrate-binding protein [Gammaproteobacteria bacterium]